MQQVVRFTEPFAKVTILRSRERWTDDEYWTFCMANSDMHIERTSDGSVVIEPPLGGETAYRITNVTADLAHWSHGEQIGIALGPSVQFFLPDESGVSPDAAWVSNKSLARLTKQEKKKFLRLSPEFIVEVPSPDDNVKTAKAKMDLWISNGVQLAWLIDGDAETVYIYRKGQSPRTKRHIRELAGEGPVAGFILNLVPIWRGM